MRYWGIFAVDRAGRARLVEANLDYVEARARVRHLNAAAGREAFIADVFSF